MTEKNTSLNATGLEILARGLNNEKALDYGDFVAFVKYKKISTLRSKEDTLNYLNGTKSDAFMAEVKKPMLLELCGQVVPSLILCTHEETMKSMLNKRNYMGLFNDIYLVSDEQQRNDCEKMLGFFQEKFGKENTSMLTKAVETAEAERVNKEQEINARAEANKNQEMQAKTTENVRCLTK